MDLITTNKSIVCILGDYKEKLKNQLSNFEGGMQQFIILLELEYKKLAHQGGGIMKLSWLNKLKTFPSVVIWIYDISESEKLNSLLDNYNSLKQTLLLAKKFQPKIIIILTGRNVGGFDFNYLKKEIDLRKVFAVEFENIGQQLKRLKKMIVEDSQNFYQELFNRYKADASNLQKQEMSDQKLILEIKKTLISEIENNSKKTNKHLQQSYEIVTQLASKRRELLTFTEDNSFYLSYELLLQAEEYREIADQLRFKLFRNLEYQDVIQQFEIHFKTFKNIIQYNLFDIQEYLWRVKIFTSIIRFLESKILTVNYNVVYNYCQTTLLSYIKLLNLGQQQTNAQMEQYGCQIYKSEPEFLGRPNYVIRENDQIIEIKSEKKRYYYQQIMNFRQKEIELAPDVSFIFDIWKQYNDNGQVTYQYTNIYFKYLQILIQKNFDLKLQIQDNLIQFGLIEEYKNLIYLQYQTAPLIKQIQLLSEILLYEQSKITDIKKLASQLTEKLDIVVPANSFISISKLESDESFVQLKIEMNINQQILDLIETGIIYCRNYEIEFIATQNSVLQTDKAIEKPVQIKLFGKYLDKLSVTIICQDVDLFSNKYKVSYLSQKQRDPPIINFSSDIAYINEINEIQVELSYSTEIELIGFNLNKNTLQKFKETDNKIIKTNKFTILITETQIQEKNICFRILGDIITKKIKFMFPFTYKVKLKQLSSVYQNAQNRNKNSVSSFSRCSLQLEIYDLVPEETEFVPVVDLDFYNKNKFNVIFQTREQTSYLQFGYFRVKYQRNSNRYEINVYVNDVIVQSYLQNVEIISPPTCKTQQTFEIQVKLKTSEAQNFFIQLKDQEKKQFFVMGKVKQMIWVNDEVILSYLLFPIDIGKCNLPGIQIEIRQPNNPIQLVFDSSGMKSILILP
ncbi:unnamed protein product [Paramecium octaurelia]|uniref:Uncharacterized protein n=1 Tax=Paramecium octaurelia TaxID=43137 RepID=A0A8S1SQU7_PAROT|nr:unnamed protein product [Paramecium octaurelia]